MECKEIREILSLYIDNMLDENIAEEISMHLSSCDACKNEYEELLSLTAILNDLPDVEIPKEFDERLHTALLGVQMEDDTEMSVIIPIKGKRSWWRRLSAVAAIFVVGIFAFAMYNNTDQLIPNKYDANAQMESEKTAQLEDKDDRQADVLDDSINPEARSGENHDENSADLKNAVKEKAESTAYAASNTANEASHQADDSYGETLDMSPPSMPDRGNGFYKPYCSDEAISYHKLSGAAIQDARDSVAIRYYMKALEKELILKEFEILSINQDDDGRWHFEVEIVSTDENEEQVYETINYIGQDGMLWIEE